MIEKNSDTGKSPYYVKVVIVNSLGFLSFSVSVLLSGLRGFSFIYRKSFLNSFYSVIAGLSLFLCFVKPCGFFRFCRPAVFTCISGDLRALFYFSGINGFTGFFLPLFLAQNSPRRSLRPAAARGMTVKTILSVVCHIKPLLSAPDVHHQINRQMFDEPYLSSHRRSQY